MLLTESFSLTKKLLPLYDLSLGIGIILLAAVFHDYADRILLFSWVLVFGYFLFTGRIDSLVHLLLATLVAVVWVHFAKEYYGYKFQYLILFGMNTLPLMAWTMSIMGLGEVCNHLKLSRKIYHLLVFIPIFWTLLILFETIAYHVLGVRNTMTGSFVGLPYCDCIHAPTWMKVVYFSMGPVYYGSTKLVDRFLGHRFPEFYKSNSGSENQFKNGLFIWN